MNELIESIFVDFEVNNVIIPVEFMKYSGSKETYITYQQVDIDNTFYGDDELLNYVDYYDFDIYSKTDYFDVIKSVRKKLEENGFKWNPANSSGDMYESDTGFYHKTLNFAVEREDK